MIEWRRMFRVDWRLALRHLRSPFGFSIILHLLLIIVILIASVQQHRVYQVAIQRVQDAQTTKIVQAQVISQSAYQHQQRVRQQKIAAQRAAERRAEQARQRKKAAHRRYLKRLAEQKKARLQAQKRRKAALARKRDAEKKQQRLAAERLRRKKRQEQHAHKQAAEKRSARELAHKKKAIADKLRQQALTRLGQQITADEKAQAAAQALRQMQLTQREKYIGLIQQTIRANWINQFSQSQALTVVLGITLDLRGQVQSVHVLRSSGNNAFDLQAILAVRKSSPLPMPPDKTLAKEFEHIKLPFSNIG